MNKGNYSNSGGGRSIGDVIGASIGHIIGTKGTAAEGADILPGTGRITVTPHTKATALDSLRTGGGRGFSLIRDQNLQTYQSLLR